jgi:biopolymer transport protein ExbD
MTEIITPGPVRRRAGVRKMMKHGLKTDMTPMVDLGFLLITFFVITAELSKPKALPLFMPTDKGGASKAEASKSLTILTGANNNLFYYFGTEEEAEKNNAVISTNWSEMNGIGKIIREKQEQLDQLPGGRSDMVVVIKPGKTSTYKNAVDILDEMMIHRVTRYAIVKPSGWEEKLMSIPH